MSEFSQKTFSQVKIEVQSETIKTLEELKNSKNKEQTEFVKDYKNNK